jgi:hypothetical protein
METSEAGANPKTDQPYEPPAVVALGSVSELTAEVGDSSLRPD